MSSFESCRDTFATLVPELTHMARAAFRHLHPEAQEEAVQNSLALAWYAYHALIQQGRADHPGILKSVLWYSIKQTKSGRTVPGDHPEKPRDVYRNSRKGRVQFERVGLGAFIADTTPIPDQVSFRIDVPAFLRTLSERQQQLAEALMSGETTNAVAKQFKVTPGAISQFRQRFKDLFDVYMAG